MTLPVPDWHKRGAIALAFILLPLPLSANRSRAAAPIPVAAGDPGPGPSEVEAAFTEGYASALLHEILGIHGFTISLDARTLDVVLEREPDPPIDRVLRNLLGVRGIEQVRIHVGERLLAESPAPAAPTSPTSPTSLTSPTAEPSVARAESESESASASASEGPTDADAHAGEGYEIFPKEELFATLIADPRWPRFSVSHQWYLDDDELGRVGATSFGETFAFVRSPEADWGRWEISLQAGVFSVFDLEAASFDLVNSDFLVGLSASHHAGDVTTMLRIYHQSSHLGDEFLLRNRVDRINLSFEVLDLLLSYEPWSWLRLYGGGGLLVHREPDIDRGITQLGLELTSPNAFLKGYLRPLAAIDLQHREESDWKTDLSLRSGVQIEHPRLASRRLQILGEFYSGRSPNGQFFERSIKTLGVGIHLGF